MCRFGEQLNQMDGPAPFTDQLTSKPRSAEGWRPRTLKEIFEKGYDVSGPTVRIYSDGVFDLFHFGHAEQLRRVKQLIPNSYLIAGVCSDADCHRYKGGATVMNEAERWQTLSHCRYVDEIHRSPPFFPTVDFVNSLQVDLVAHDAIPYPIGSQIEDCYSIFKRTDRFLETERTPNISTTDIVQRILENFDIYRSRQIARGML